MSGSIVSCMQSGAIRIGCGVGGEIRDVRQFTHRSVGLCLV